MKKIAQVITQSEMGGAQKHVILLAKEFKARGYEIDIIAGGDGPLKKIANDIGVGYIEDPYMVREISLGIDRKNLKYLKKLFSDKRYDIVQSKKTPILEKITKELLYDC